MLVTLNTTPGKAVYGEKRIEIPDATDDTQKKEYRQWNPFRSKLGAAILSGIGNIYMKPGAKVLYLGASTGTTVSHVSDLVGPVRFHCRSSPFVYTKTGAVYAVEFSERTGRELMEVAKSRTNIVPIMYLFFIYISCSLIISEDARKPQKYRMLVPMCDVVFADVAQPNQAQILAVNASYFIKNGGGFVISIKASCIDSTVPPESVFASEVQALKKFLFKPKYALLGAVSD